MKPTNPKKFWKILQGKTGSQELKTEAIFADIVNHFKELNQSFDNSPSPTIQNLDNPINNDFTLCEVENAIKKLKWNKACGIDGIVNEFLIDTSIIIAPILTKLFNIVINTGIVPDVWGIGVITPIFKNNGPTRDPSNYRGISILSCIGKLFTLLLNERLTKFIDDFGILGENQAGFRHKYSTIYHIFSLKCIIDIYTRYLNKKLYCAFIDFKKAFDSISRNKLWHKLISNGINGKILSIISNLYKKAKSCVKHPNGFIQKYSPHRLE